MVDIVAHEKVFQVELKRAPGKLKLVYDFADWMLELIFEDSDICVVTAVFDNKK